MTEETTNLLHGKITEEQLKDWRPPMPAGCWVEILGRIVPEDCDLSHTHMPVILRQTEQGNVTAVLLRLGVHLTDCAAGARIDYDPDGQCHISMHNLETVKSPRVITRLWKAAQQVRLEVQRGRPDNTGTYTPNELYRKIEAYIESCRSIHLRPKLQHMAKHLSLSERQVRRLISEFYGMNWTEAVRVIGAGIQEPRKGKNQSIDAIRRCAVCGKGITARFWVCAACEKEYGLVGQPYRNWPDWVKALVIEHQRARRLQVKMGQNERDQLWRDGIDPNDDEAL